MNGPIITVATLPEQDTPRTDAEVLAAQAAISKDLMSVDGVSSVLPFGVSADTSTLEFQVVSTTGPADPATVDTVEAIHFSAETLRGRHTGTEIGLTGRPSPTSTSPRSSPTPCRSTSRSSSGSRCMILVVVFRSILVPIIATGGFALSLFAALGGTVAIFQWGWLAA